MSESAAAERYARAIFELGEESGQLPQLAEQLGRFNQTLSGSPQLLSVLLNPTLEESKRDAIIKSVASRLALNPTATNAVRLLSERHRLRVLPEINERLRSLADEKQGVVRVTVTSAQALPDSYFQRLSQEIAQTTGKRVVLEKKQDPSLIAGVVTQIGDNTIDGSLKGRLQEYERQLLAAE